MASAIAQPALTSTGIFMSRPESHRVNPLRGYEVGGISLTGTDIVRVEVGIIGQQFLFRNAMGQCLKPVFDAQAKLADSRLAGSDAGTGSNPVLPRHGQRNSPEREREHRSIVPGRSKERQD